MPPDLKSDRSSAYVTRKRIFDACDKFRCAEDSKICQEDNVWSFTNYPLALSAEQEECRARSFVPEHFNKNRTRLKTVMSPFPAKLVVVLDKRRHDDAVNRHVGLKHVHSFFACKDAHVVSQLLESVRVTLQLPVADKDYFFHSKTVVFPSKSNLQLKGGCVNLTGKQRHARLQLTSPIVFRLRGGLERQIIDPTRVHPVSVAAQIDRFVPECGFLRVDAGLVLRVFA